MIYSIFIITVNEWKMTNINKHKLILVIGIILEVVGIILIGIAGSYISINPSPIRTYGLLLGGFLFFMGIVLIIFEIIIRIRIQRKNPDRKYYK